MVFTKKLIKNKKQMKNLLVVLLVALSFNGFAQQKELVWHTDVEKAINLSVQSGKPLFFFFTGSDWCGWCIKLQKEVFFKPEFVKWAKENIVLVDVRSPEDFIAGKITNAINIPLDKIADQAEQLQKHSKKQLLFYCQKGFRSSQAVKIVSKLGLSNSVSIDGGMDAWVKENLPIVSGA